MATLHMDHIDGRPRGVKDEKGWVLLERVGRVTALTGTGYQLHKNALAVWGLPAIGDVHPNVADLYVTKQAPEIIDKGVVDVRITYERRDEEDNPDYAEISHSTSLVQVQSYEDIHAALIETEYDGKKQGGTVPFDAPVSQLVYRRRASGPPSANAEDFVGALNSGPWSLKPNAAQWEWKYSRFDSTSTDGGKSYIETYVFDRAPWVPLGGGAGWGRSWDQQVAYIDPATGKIPEGVIDGVQAVKDLAIKKVMVHIGKDFSALGL